MSATCRRDGAASRVDKEMDLPHPGPQMTLTTGLPALLSGLLLVVIFPWYDLQWLAWVALVPLLLVTRGSRLRSAFCWGWIAGGVGYLGILRWVPHTMINYGGVPTLVSYGILLLLVLYVAVYIGAFALGWAWCSQAWPGGVWVVMPALWVALEWVRARALSGFPWASLGYSQYLNGPLLQIAEWTSVYGVSFALVLGNILIAQLLHGLKHRQWRLIGLPGVASAVCLAAVWAFGGWRLQQVADVPAAGVDALGVALIQGNIAQDLKWDRAAREEIFAVYETLTRQAAAEPDVDLIVWPEAATPFFFANERDFRARLLRLMGEVERPLLFGSPTYAREDGQDVMYNSAFLVGADAAVLGRYDKIHLVPFGEYIPWRRLLFFLEKIVEGIGDFRSGEAYTVMAVPQGRFAVLICFEVIFPELVRHFGRHGAQFLVNITNDAWFGRSPASYQHLSMVVFRAVENRLPIVRSANTGISAVISPTGRLVQQTDLFVRTWIKDQIAPAHRPLTFYALWGDVFAYSCWGVIVLTFTWGIIRGGLHPSTPHDGRC
jgi:apolipoprotein N-acyltransferase